MMIMDIILIQKKINIEKQIFNFLNLNQNIEFVKLILSTDFNSETCFFETQIKNLTFHSQSVTHKNFDNIHFNIMNDSLLKILNFQTILQILQELNSWNYTFYYTNQNTDFKLLSQNEHVFYLSQILNNQIKQTNKQKDKKI